MNTPADKAAAIRAVYAAVHAPSWAAPNLDGLADVLRDLSWLPSGPVVVPVPRLDALPAPDRQALRAVLARCVVETAAGPRPIELREAG
jgi:hypothetical protein